MDAQLIPVFSGTVQGRAVLLVDARPLHVFLEVARDFSNWIKKRLSDGGFIKDVDFIVVDNLSSPNLASAKARAQKLTDFHLTLETAKHIGMMERNESGDRRAGRA